MRLVFSFLPYLALLVLVSSAIAETIAGKVVAVSDGDTITVLLDETQIKVRFHGIDCPESGQDYGRAAKVFTAEHCFQQEVTVLVTDTDRYGRKVGLIVLKDGRVLNHELVAEGLAHWYAEYAPDDIALKTLHETARLAKRGLWSRPDAISPAEFRRGGRKPSGVPFNPPSKEDVAKPVTSTGESTGAGTVYLSATGTKYHRVDCRTLKGTKKAVSRDAAVKSNYKPCGVCRP